MKIEKQTQLYNIALVGQPNTGKSTVFNLLTGMNQHVGNWPGKTVEKKEGEFSYNGNMFRMIDLPGTYSMSANSAEELIARDYLIKKRPNLIIVLVNAATLERNLYLVAEVLALKLPVVIALNMMDVAGDEGKLIRPDVLESRLGVKVVPMVASKKKGLNELLKVLDSGVGKESLRKVSAPQAGREHQSALCEIRRFISGIVPEPYSEDWVALKLLEGDKEIRGLMKSRLDSRWRKLQEVLSQHKHAMKSIVDGRYKWINQVTKGVVDHSIEKVASITARWDKWATHPIIGFFLMIGILIAALALGMAISLPIAMGLLANGRHALEIWASGLMPVSIPWLAGFVQGVIRGVGTVFALIPFLMAMFTVFYFLEDVGYMARIAYLMDRFLSRIGLHGKSFMPLLFSLPCNICGVVASRVVDTHRARLLTILLTPLVPCAAQIAITAYIAGMFFRPFVAITVVICLALLNVLVLGITGLLLDRTLFRSGERLGFIMELPLYHRPNFRIIWNQVWSRTREFIRKASSIIVGFTILIWWLAYFPTGNIDTSYLGQLSVWLTPVGNLMGLEWRMVTVLFASVVSKEAALATMGVIFSAESTADLSEILCTVMTPPGAVAFLVAQMIFLPCVATMGVMCSESKSFKLALGMVVYMGFLSFALAIITYQVLRQFI
jgi:ferrous iron transport protein B